MKTGSTLWSKKHWVLFLSTDNWQNTTSIRNTVRALTLSHRKSVTIKQGSVCQFSSAYYRKLKLPFYRCKPAISRLLTIGGPILPSTANQSSKLQGFAVIFEMHTFCCHAKAPVLLSVNNGLSFSRIKETCFN